MCGIYGFTHQGRDPLAGLKLMGELQKHRGPDGEGHYADEKMALGMRRLSIIDLEHGQQPFYGRDGSVVVVCNGEIYNYIELRRQLISLGHQFKTNSDVEVLPHLYAEYGEKFVELVNGMFAIALYDKKAGKLLLYRDRLGIKPLYYALVGEDIIFASELKSILALDKVERRLDQTALSAYLDLLYIPAPRTPFAGISKLVSGAYLSFCDGQAVLRKYWEPELRRAEIRDEAQALAAIEPLLRDSVKLEMRSDVPVGSFLSGGVDSSAVTALASLQSDKQFSTFHMEWPGAEEKLDERAYAAMVVERYQTRHCVKAVSEAELIAGLPKLIWHLEEPFADGAFVPTYGLARIAADQVKVILSGAGGDELFGGYAHHQTNGPLISLLRQLARGRNPRRSYRDKWAAGHNRAWPAYFDWYRPGAMRREVDRYYSRTRGLDELNATMLSDLMVYLQDDILFMTDKMTMAASLECRVPLLDHRLVELSLTIDSGLKVRGGERKYILKKLMEKYLPRPVLDRPKEGVGAPVTTWLNKYRAKYFDRLLADSLLAGQGLASREKIRALTLKERLDREEAWAYWKVLVLEIWLRLFVGGEKHEEIFG